MFDYLYTQRFQHTAARRRLHKSPLPPLHRHAVSTHSRPKAAANSLPQVAGLSLVSTHSRPKAAAFAHKIAETLSRVSTHSRPKAAADIKKLLIDKDKGFQHTAARRRLQTKMTTCAMYWMFQHTAARRRLRLLLGRWSHVRRSFNTQPPEGGCDIIANMTFGFWVFQHTAARRRLLARNSSRRNGN